MKNLAPKAREIHRAIINTNGQKKLPPYGKALQDPITNDVRVFAGSDAWRFANENSYPWKLLLPPGEHPSNYGWPVSGASALVFQCGTILDAELEALARTLLFSGAYVVRVIQGGHLAVFKGMRHAER